MTQDLIRVLIIDDDEFSCDGVKVLLSYHKKYEFYSDDCKTLKEALELDLDSYDIIILDMFLPDSKGASLYKSISSSTITPILVLSGYPDLAMEAAKAGAQGYLIKPVSHDILIQSLIFTIEKSRLISKIKTEEKKFKMVVEDTSDSIVIYATINGEDFKIINMNSSAEKLEKIDRKKALGKLAEDVFPYVKKYNFVDVFKKVYKTGQPQEVGLEQYPDDTWRTNYVYKLPSDEIVNVCYDQTNMINILKELEEKEKMLRCSFNFNRDIIFITNMDHNILDRNRSFNKFLKYHYLHDKEICDKEIWKDLSKREEFLNILQQSGQNLNQEVVFSDKNGVPVYCIVSAYILETKIYYFVHDVTRERESWEVMSKSKGILSHIRSSTLEVKLQEKIDEWEADDEVKFVLRKEKIDEIDSIINDIQKISGEK